MSHLSVQFDSPNLVICFLCRFIERVLLQWPECYQWRPLIIWTTTTTTSKAKRPLGTFWWCLYPLSVPTPWGWRTQWVSHDHIIQHWTTKVVRPFLNIKWCLLCILFELIDVARILIHCSHTTAREYKVSACRVSLTAFTVVLYGHHYLLLCLFCTALRV